MIERSKEYRRIWALVGRDLIVSDKVYYLIDVDPEDGCDAGVWIFHNYGGEMAMHAEMDQYHRGAYARRSAQQAVGWMFENSDTSVIVAVIPPTLRYVHYMARCIGMKQDGFDETGLRCYRLEKPGYERKAA